MKECELCEMAARMYCESDDASLCRQCDAKVHGANFLVARHSRSLLCQVCQAVTAWRASGSNPGLTVSVCEKCVARSRQHQNDCDGIDENQVVPFTSGIVGPPPSSPSTEDDDDDDDEKEHEGDSEFEFEGQESHYVERFTLPSAGSVWGSNTGPESSPLKRMHEILDLQAVELLKFRFLPPILFSQLIMSLEIHSIPWVMILDARGQGLVLVLIGLPAEVDVRMMQPLLASAD